MNPRVRSWALIAAAAIAVAVAAVAASAGGGEGPGTVEHRMQAIASGLRCPVCQNLSVADSPSRLAGEMRAEIESQLRAGRSADQIRGYFVERYTEWVLLEPPRRGLGLLPWLVPVAGVLLGLGVWAMVVRRRAPDRSSSDPTEPGEAATQRSRGISEGERERIRRELSTLEEPG